MTVRSAVVVAALGAACSLAPTASAQCVSVNGRVDRAVEGWTLLTEAANCVPSIGGSASSSDAVAESSGFNWWDGINSVNVPMNDNRGDIIQLFWYADSQYLYLACTGPTLPFNSFTDNGPKASNDQGDLYIVLDASLNSGTDPIVNTPAVGSTQCFGFRAVDFSNTFGFSPSHVFAVQFVDNGNGGGGRAKFESLSPYSATPDIPQQNETAGILWHATLNSSAAYDTRNQNAGEFEVRIPWSSLGFPGRPGPGFQIGLAAFTAQNFASSDAYDSAPGIGNGTFFEQIGDCPGDQDAGPSGTLGACDAGSFGASQPGANFVASLTFQQAFVGPQDEVDTIAAHFRFVPTPICQGDLDFNGVTNTADLVLFLGAFGTNVPPNTLGDSDCNGVVNTLDLTAFLGAFGCGA
ncbi:MAG: hypothetical protein J0L61_05605 [Planctomycetes bacterium]|nr:hypothetical protein [Planctomycetota bacterium]